VPRPASSWVLPAAGLAVVLWLLATMLENRLQAPEQMPAGNEAGVPERTGDAVPSPDGADGVVGSMSCQETEDRLKLFIERARSCNVDDDCTLFDYGYPLDCMTSVAKDQVPGLRQEYRRYDESCEHRVFYDCPTEPYVRLAVCRNNRCIVELDRRDDLEEATLDRLNRSGPGQVP
jgi:hypothetical protein